jgi:hypothetical protein
VSYAELYRDVRGCGKIGRYLVDQLVEFNSERSFAGYSPNGIASVTQPPSA